MLLPEINRPSDAWRILYIRLDKKGRAVQARLTGYSSVYGEVKFFFVESFQVM